MNNHNEGCFKTLDIHLAVFLKCRGIELREIQPAQPHQSIFVFEPVGQKLLAEWLSTEAKAPVRLVINEYRHLLRTSREYASLLSDAGVRQ